MNRRPPSYRLHKARNLAVVTLGGRDIYLGKHGSPESLAEYDRLIAEWLASGRGRPPQKPTETEITAAEVMAQYWSWAGQHYRAKTDRSGTLHNLKESLKPLKRLYAHTPAVKFGPLALKAVRKSMIDGTHRQPDKGKPPKRLARSTINGRIGKIKQMFRWAVENELLPGSVSHALDAVKGLQRGREGVREAAPVKPVSDADVAATLPFLSSTLRAMVELQRLTGMRPGEAMAITTGAIDRSGPVWIYRPVWHKTVDRGKVRQIPIGPKGQEVLTPWLKDNPDAFLFSPLEAVERRNEKRRAACQTPMTPSQRKRGRKRKPKRTPRERYHRETYRNAIARACDRAGIASWHPNQLRHTLATEVRRHFGLEASQTVLGHSRADVTQVYAERDLAAAVDVMRQIG